MNTNKSQQSVQKQKTPSHPYPLQTTTDYQKSRVLTHIQPSQKKQLFYIELTAAQASVINRTLPKSYVLCVCNNNRNRNKRAVKIRKNFSLQNSHSSVGENKSVSGSAKKNNKNIGRNNRRQDQDEHDQDSKKNKEQFYQQPDIQLQKDKKLQTNNPTNNNNPNTTTLVNNSNNSQDTIKKCNKLLSILKKNKVSWPFRDPVDPISMGIPHYSQIIKNPMDLSTVTKNLNSNVYQTVSQFYADIQLIIKNSYLFNQNNAQFKAITEEFQKLFHKLKNQNMPGLIDSPLISMTKLIKKPISQTSIQSNPNTLSNPKKKSQNKPSQSADLKLRKQLVVKLKTLSRQQLIQLVHSLKMSNQQQLNMQTLPVQKVQYIQEYFRDKQSKSAVHQSSKRAKQPMRKVNQKQESSFQSDSDS